MRREEVLRMGSANHGTAPESVSGRFLCPQRADGLVQLLDLYWAIEALARENPEPARVIEMRYFGGMTAEETSAAVGRSVHIVRHELRFGHAWLRRRLAGKSR
jgi:DNA-directed RNA polymerase specialized sigma24 family protein